MKLSRRHFVTGLLSTSLLPVLGKSGALITENVNSASQSTQPLGITWTETSFDWGEQFAIAGEYKDRRQAVRIRKRVEDVTDEDRRRMKSTVTQWFEERA